MKQLGAQLTPQACGMGEHLLNLSIHCRFHDLRHYNASIMLALNIPDK